jgi:hypothetical protein
MKVWSSEDLAQLEERTDRQMVSTQLYLTSKKVLITSKVYLDLESQVRSMWPSRPEGKDWKDFVEFTMFFAERPALPEGLPSYFESARRAWRLAQEWAHRLGLRPNR